MQNSNAQLMQQMLGANPLQNGPPIQTSSLTYSHRVVPPSPQQPDTAKSGAIRGKGLMTNPTVSVGENFRENQEEIDYGAAQMVQQHIQQSTPIVSYMDDATRRKFSNLVTQQISYATIPNNHTLTPQGLVTKDNKTFFSKELLKKAKASHKNQKKKIVSKQHHMNSVESASHNNQPSQQQQLMHNDRKLTILSIQKIMAGSEPESASLPGEKNVIRNIEIDTGAQQRQDQPKNSKQTKNQLRGSAKNNKMSNNNNKEGLRSQPDTKLQTKSQQIQIMPHHSDELPNNQQFQPAVAHNHTQEHLQVASEHMAGSLGNFAVMRGSVDDDGSPHQIIGEMPDLHSDQQFHRNAKQPMTTGSTQFQEELLKTLYPQSNNQDHLQQQLLQYDSKKSSGTLNSPLPQHQVRTLQHQNFMGPDALPSSTANQQQHAGAKTNQQRRVTRSQDMRKQAKMTAGQQAPQQIYTAKGRPSAEQNGKRYTVYQQRNEKPFKSSPLTPQEQTLQSNIQGSHRNNKKQQNFKQSQQAMMPESQVSMRSSSQKINSFDRQPYQKRFLSKQGFERSASLGRNGYISNQAPGSWRKIQRQQLKKSIKGIQHQLFGANKQVAKGVTNTATPNVKSANKQQAAMPLKQDKGNNNLLIEGMGGGASGAQQQLNVHMQKKKQFSVPQSKQVKQRQQTNSKQIRRSIEPVIDRSQKVGTVSPESEKMSSIKIIQRSNNLIDHDLMNSVEQVTKSILATDNNNEVAAEVQTPNVDPLIIQSYQELYGEINLVKVAQLEDSEKLMQALETLRNFEGNNLQISERISQIDQLTTQSLEETQKSQKQLSQVVKKQLVPFIQRLNTEQKTQNDKFDALMEASSQKDQIVFELKNEIDQMKGQLIEAMNMIGDPKPHLQLTEQSEVKDWVNTELNRFNDEIKVIEELKHEQKDLKLQCKFLSNNIENMQFQIQNQLKIFQNLQEYKDTQKQITRLEQNMQQKDDDFQQLNDHIQEMTRRIAEMKRQSENGSSNMSQLEERRMVKKLEDKVMLQIQNVDENCQELWQHHKQYKEILKQQDMKFDQLKQMIDVLQQQRPAARDRRSNNNLGPSPNSNLGNFRGDSDDDDEAPGAGGGGPDTGPRRQSVSRQNDPVVRQSAFMEYLESMRAEIQVFNQDQNDQLRQQMVAQIDQIQQQVLQQHQQNNRSLQAERPSNNRVENLQQSSAQQRNSQGRGPGADADQNNMFNRSQQSVQNNSASEYPRPPTEIQEEDHPHLLAMQVSNLDPNNREEQVSGAASFNQMHRSQNQSQIYQNDGQLIENYDQRNYDQLHESQGSNNNNRPRDIIIDGGDQVQQDIINLINNDSDQHQAGPINQQIQGLQRQVAEMQVQLNRYEPLVNQTQQILQNFDQIQQSINLMEQRIHVDEDLQAQSLQQISTIKESARFIQCNLDQILVRIQKIETELGVGDEDPQAATDEQNQIDSSTRPSTSNLSQSEKRILKKLKQTFKDKFDSEFNQSQQNLQDIKTLQYLMGILQDSNFQEQINNLRRLMNRYLRSNVQQQQRIGIDPNRLDQLSNNPEQIDNRIDFSPNVIAVPHTDREVQGEDIFMDREDYGSRPRGLEGQHRRDRRVPNLESPHRQQQPNALQQPSIVAGNEDPSFQQRDNVNDGNNEPQVDHIDHQLEISQDHQDNNNPGPSRRNTHSNMPSGAPVLVGPAGLSTLSHSSQLNQDHRQEQQQQLYNSIQAINSEQNSLNAVPMGQQTQAQPQNPGADYQGQLQPGHVLNAARNTFLSNEAAPLLHEQEQLRPQLQQPASALVDDSPQINDSMNRSPDYMQNRSNTDEQQQNQQQQLSLSAIQFERNPSLARDPMQSQSNASKESEGMLRRMGRSQVMQDRESFHLSQEMNDDQKVLDGLVDYQQEMERKVDQITDELLDEQVLQQVTAMLDEIIRR